MADHTDRNAEARERLTAAIADLTTSEGWLRWLNARSKFHTYSLHNSIMIAMQRPDATHVAGYQTWRKLDRQVRKGEKGIAIFAPVIRKVTDTATGDDERRVVGFRIVHVFDIAQTDGEPLAEPPVTRLAGEGPEGAEAALRAVADRAGLRVDTRPTGDALGWLRREERLIALSDALTGAERVAVLAHELAHWFDAPLADGTVNYTATRGECETVAEASAYIVADRLGLDTSGYSTGYVADWSNGDALAVEKLAARIDTAVGAIMGALEALPELVAA